MSLLVPHLNGKAFPIRSAIIGAVGHLISLPNEAVSGADAEGICKNASVYEELTCSDFWYHPATFREITFFGRNSIFCTLLVPCSFERLEACKLRQLVS